LVLIIDYRLLVNATDRQHKL